MSAAPGCAVKVLFFASLREDVGVDELVVEAQDLPGLMAALRTRLGATGMQVLEQENVRIAVNQELVAGAASFCDGDEVAFLPPVTGG